MELTFEYEKEIFSGKLSSVAVFRDATMGVFYSSDDNKELMGRILTLDSADANAFTIGSEFCVGSFPGSILSITSASISCHNIISVNTSTRHRAFLVTDNGSGVAFLLEAPAPSHNRVSVL